MISSTSTLLVGVRCLALALVMILGGTTASFAQPANDAFANRTQLVGSDVLEIASNVGATIEPGEVAAADGQTYEASVWWSWTAPADGQAFILTAASDFDTQIRVFTGATLGALDLVAFPDSAVIGGPQMHLRLPVVQGTAYAIAVGGEIGGQRGTEGTIRFQLQFAEVPANDRFDRRVVLTGSEAESVGKLGVLTYGELGGNFGYNYRPQGGDAWWSWIAPADGPAVISVQSGPTDPENPVLNRGARSLWLEVNVGSGPGEFVEGMGYDEAYTFGPPALCSVKFEAVAGTEYHGQVAGNLGFNIPCTVRVAQTHPPSIAVVNPLAGATFREGEPIAIHAEFSDLEDLLLDAGLFCEFEPYDDHTISGAVPQVEYLRTLPSLGVRLTQAPIGRYALTVWSMDARGGVGKSLPIEFNVRPVNDAFRDRAVLEGASWSIVGTTANATAQPGEPGEAWDQSVWYAWTAPEQGTFTLSAKGQPDPPQTVAVYSGEAMTALLPVAEGSPDWDSTSPIHVSFPADEGAGYVIRVTGISYAPLALSVARGEPPVVTLTHPQPDTTVDGDEPFALTSDVWDPDGVVTTVSYYADAYGAARLLGASTMPPFTIEASLPYSLGQEHQRLYAEAVDDQGILSASRFAEVRVLPNRADRPVNDDFGDRISLVGDSIEVVGSLHNATREPDESNGSEGSVWWSWTAPQDGVYTISMATSEFSRRLTFYEGDSLSGLNRVGDAEPGDPVFCPGQLVIQAQAQQEFVIAVEGSPYSEEVGFAIAPTSPPQINLVSPAPGAVYLAAQPIALVAEAEDLDGAITRVEFFEYNLAELIATDDSAPYAYDWTPDRAQVHNTVMAVAIDDLGVRQCSELVSFEVRQPPPANDDFADRIFLSGDTFVAQGACDHATYEEGEFYFQDRGFGESYGSVWWSFTPSVSGFFAVQVVAEKTLDAPQLAVLTGETIGNLSIVAQRTSEQAFLGETTASFLAQAGSSYQIAVAGIGAFEVGGFAGQPPQLTLEGPASGSTVLEGEPIDWLALAGDNDGEVVRVEFFENGRLLDSLPVAPFQFSLRADLAENPIQLRARAIDNTGLSTVTDEVWIEILQKPPLNDDFVDALSLAGYLLSWRGSNGGATLEQGEPALVDGQEVGSCWWTWTAPWSGEAWLTVHPLNEAGIIVYTGANREQLVEVIRGEPVLGNSGFGMTQVRFPVTMGETYSLLFQSRWESFEASLFLETRHLRLLPRTTDGTIQGELRSTLQLPWEVQASENLQDWWRISNGTPVDGVLEFSDSVGLPKTPRFYRARSME